ncbi:MAG TPA: tol-pal system protein YbgF [Micropepsaceae bacterium]|jgi:tol-pal system protein YbgF|nr:tol-pal system protein YbgF [Micropepsaceae bacterium]
MTAMRKRWMETAAALFVGFVSLGAVQTASAASNVQVIDARDLMARIQRLERDLHDVQAETFRRSGTAGPAPAASADAAPPPAAAPVPDAQMPAIPDLNPLMRRLGDLEDSLGRLTGQMEEIGHQVDQLSQKTDRLQKQMDLQATAQIAAPPASGEALLAPSDMPPRPDNGAALASLSPDQNTAPLRGAPPANLGQIPAGAAFPKPAPPSDPKREFDGAMNLLSRAQYDQASDAFRKFADAHPDEDRAPDALYWTGDIAYSAKKDYPEAARDFAELLKKYPKAQHAPEGMLKLGLSLFELGQMKEGCAALAALPAKYPDVSPAVATRAKAERTANKCK